MRFLILIATCISCSGFAQRDSIHRNDTNLRFAKFYHTNGRVAQEGFIDNYGWTGKWNFYDTSGILWKSEWYLSEPEDADDIYLDSTYWYRSDGTVMRSKAFFASIQHCRFQKGSPKEKYRKLVTEKRWYYSNGVMSRKLISDPQECPGNTDSAQAIMIEWYRTGEIRRVCNVRGESFEYYRNGKLKMRCSADPFGPRNGIHQVRDSLGKVIIDRTYAHGKLIRANDTYYGKSDTTRVALAEKLKGVAAMSMYPGSDVSIGYKLEYPYSPLPDWQDSLYIQQITIDSLAYEWAGVCMILPDSLKFLKDSLVNLSANFHPKMGVWYYTVVFPVNDTMKFHNAYSKGILKTDNGAFDSLLSIAGYKILSWNMRKYDYAYVVFESEHPLNLLKFHKVTSGKGGVLSIYTGIRSRERTANIVQVTRRNNGDQFIRMFVTIAVDSSKTRYGNYFFISNSDHSVDLRRIDGFRPDGRYYRSEYEYWEGW